MEIDEIENEVNKVLDEHKKLCSLSDEEFLKPETGNKLNEINKRMLELTKQILKGK